MKRRSVLALASLTFLSTNLWSGDRETWSVLSAWVKELKPEEQRVALLLLAGNFNQHYTTKIVPANQSSVENARWAIRMFGWSRFLLSELATKNEDMRRFFKDDADRARALSLNWSSQKWVEDGKNAQRQMNGWANAINHQVGEKFMKDHAEKLQRTSTGLIVSSMDGASIK